MRKRPQKKNPRKRIDGEAVERICALIRSWPSSPLTWEALVEAIAQSERSEWTRQGLSNHEDIGDAYRTRKVDLRNGPKPVRDPEVVILKRQAEEKETAISKLEAKLAHYEERQIIMMRNAVVRGITLEELERPLPPIDRTSI
ncbi:hypothetical protein FJ434_01285 [Mesorhizobium sp. B2-5-13]|uniref:hypothetical protein n=1 Tax=unclassified Mesorhizobium TaxID=325217 RepID=UPI00112DCF97|nr:MULTISPECIES: hypothetical protein [unclassified Mesorhizobium]TPJ43459.1 hypothetical protein FJ432_05905 [Mesorhizobium sp. B2-6-5]TPJ93360.1 hypothetical protein FJ434_01285 [Mesorhizobium sp. B2-5-13]TPK47555.1 hypothetical protein FJ560_17000 [Mesorhizobium sp. B2-5-5]